MVASPEMQEHVWQAKREGQEDSALPLLSEMVANSASASRTGPQCEGPPYTGPCRGGRTIWTTCSTRWPRGHEEDLLELHLCEGLQLRSFPILVGPEKETSATEVPHRDATPEGLLRDLEATMCRK